MRFNRLLVDDQIGALSAFATLGDNKLFGISANHVLSGSDGNLQTSDRVFARDLATGDWVDIGFGNIGYNFPGLQQPPWSYGVFDIGIFEIKVNRIPPINQLEINQSIQNGRYDELTGLHVFSYSVMDDRVISGIVSGVFMRSLSGTPFDLIIESDDGDYLTKKGDSGVLWTDVEGAAIGVHIYGFNNPSKFSYCVLIDRVCEQFAITGLWKLS